MKKRAFTLIELLVVIAIIAVLMGILMPSLKAAREQARGLRCSSNVRNLVLAWLMYKDENDTKLVPGDTRAPSNSFSPSEPACWVKPPVTNFSNDILEQEKEGIRQGLLFPYIKDVDVYRCPSDRRKTSSVQAYRSFSIAGAAYGEGYNNFKTGAIAFSKTYSDIKSPSQKYIFLAETDPRGLNIGSWIMNANNKTWIDPFAIWHSKHRTTLGWADGRAVMHKWQDKSTKTMSDNAINAVFAGNTSASPSTGFHFPVPAEEGADLEFMFRGYPLKNGN